MWNVVGSVVCAATKGPLSLMPWGSYVVCYVMVHVEGKGSGEEWKSFKLLNIILCCNSETILQLLGFQ
jgi:hypothetical protein